MSNNLNCIPCEIDNFAIIMYQEDYYNELVEIDAAASRYYLARIDNVTDSLIEINDGEYDREKGVYMGDVIYRIGEKIAVITRSYTDGTPLFFVEDPKVFWEVWRRQN